MTQKYQVSPAQICLRWVYQQGAVLVPKSNHPSRIKQNAQITSFKLNQTDLKLLRAIPQKISGIGVFRGIFSTLPSLLAILGNWAVIFVAGLFYQFFFLSFIFGKNSPLFTDFIWAVFWMGILTFLVRELISLVAKRIKR